MPQNPRSSRTRRNDLPRGKRAGHSLVACSAANGRCRGEASAPTWLAETARAVGLLATIEVLRGPSAVTHSH